MIKFKIYDKGDKSNPEYLFSSFEELYYDLLNSRYLSSDCEYLTDYILQKFKLNFSDWDSFLNDLIENDKESDYFSDFDKFLISKNIDYSINSLTDKDYYNIIQDNINLNGSYKIFYQFVGPFCVDIGFYEIDEFIIKFFDKSGNNIIDQLIFIDCDYLNKLDYERKGIFFKLFHKYITEYNYSLDKILKILKITKNKMINTDNNTFIYLDNSDCLYEYLSFKEFQELEVNNDNNNIWIEGAYFIDDCESVKNINAIIDNQINEKEPYQASYYLEEHKDAPEWELLYNDYLNNIENILNEYQNIDFDISKILDIL